MIRFFGFFVAILLATFAAPASAQDRNVTTQFVRLTTADGLEIAAFVMHPEAGMDVDSPAIVFHHGGFGGHGARRIGAPRSAAERFAEAGYTTITLISRHVDGYLHRDIAEARHDIAASVAYMKNRGFSEVILAGHSMGSLWTSIYQADANDPAVKAMLHFAPTHDMFPLYERKSFYEEIDQAAKAAIASGQGQYPDGPDGGTQEPPLFMSAYGRPQTAQALLNWWGDDTTNSNSDLFQKLQVPILMLGGRLDPVVPPGRMEQLQALATQSPQVDYVWYDEGDHYFTGLWDQAVSDSLAWLDEQGLGVDRPIRTSLVDTRQVLTMDAGSPQERSYEMQYPGALFEPTDQQGSAITLVLPDWKGDIFHSRPAALAESLARSGKAALVPQLRANNLRGSLDASFAMTGDDLTAWNKVANEQGYSDVHVIALGRSAFWALAYAEANPDAFASITMIDPPVSLSATIAAGLGEERYTDLIAAARARAGEGRTLLPPLQAAFERPDGSVERIIQYPDSILELIGPEARTDLAHYASLSSIPLRIIIEASASSAEALQEALPEASVIVDGNSANAVLAGL